MKPANIKEWIITHKVKASLLLTLCVLAFLYMICLPGDLFEGEQYSTVVTDREGELLGARIADDGQWRFPPSDTVPERFGRCLIEFEDRYFHLHPGVNPVAVLRAAKDNISSGKVVSGASTITMQVIRMSRGKERNLWQKAAEAIMATRLELRCSKEEILALYASHAPFGGNVVGLEAAAWRYFGRSPDDLSWGEAATLAVLPNAPSVIHPGRNRDALKSKRDKLLQRLLDREIIDSVTFVLSVEEPLPEAPLPLPDYAFHLVQNLSISHKGQRVGTGIDFELQKAAESVAERWNREFTSQGIKDLSIVVTDVHTGKKLVYIGNASPSSDRPGSKVDIASSPRSTGSILKPLLYCSLLQEGTLLPHTLLPDIPVNINGFSPQNFDLKFAGAVPASEALARSLNVPSVFMLRYYGVPRFKEVLVNAGMTTLTRDAADYGLSLILGGAEGSLAELTDIYAAMSAFYQDGSWEGWERRPERWPLTDRMALYSTFDALKEVNRPDEMDWRMISSVRKVAWKTGTSYGFRDGWAIGVTPDYAVGVWVGNAYGEGSPGLTGARTAGPVMFDIFNMLDDGGWFDFPLYDDWIEAEVCTASGHLKGQFCNDCDTLYLPKNALRSEPCPYHQVVSLTSDRKWCTGNPGIGTIQESMFLLPPAMEWYYRRHHPEYVPLPPMKPGEGSIDGLSPMEFIYPEKGSSIQIPRKLDGTPGEITFNLAHSNPQTEVFWHLDNEFIASTRHLHQLSLRPGDGPHTMTVIDEYGNRAYVSFTCYALR